MANTEGITIPLDLPRDEADAFARLLKRTTYDDCARRSNRVRKYPDGRAELDVMWSAVKLIETSSPKPALRRDRGDPGWLK